MSTTDKGNRHTNKSGENEIKDRKEERQNERRKLERNKKMRERYKEERVEDGGIVKPWWVKLKPCDPTKTSGGPVHTLTPLMPASWAVDVLGVGECVRGHLRVCAMCVLTSDGATAYAH